jgi:hypothetical protein
MRHVIGVDRSTLDRARNEWCSVHPMVLGGKEIDIKYEISNKRNNNEMNLKNNDNDNKVSKIDDASINLARERYLNRKKNKL